MNEIVNKSLLAGDKFHAFQEINFTPEMHLRYLEALGKPGFTYST